MTKKQIEKRLLELFNARPRLNYTEIADALRRDGIKTKRGHDYDKNKVCIMLLKMGLRRRKTGAISQKETSPKRQKASLIDPQPMRLASKGSIMLVNLIAGSDMADKAKLEAIRAIVNQ